MATIRSTNNSLKTRHWQETASTCLLVAAWLYANISSLKLLFESIAQASSLNLVLIGLAIAVLMVRLLRGDRRAFEISATIVLRPYPLAVMLGGAVGAIAIPWLVGMEQLALLLFLLGTYGLCGLFLASDSWRKGLPVAIAIACILPFSTQLSAGLGMPARILTARAVEQLLSAWHVAAISSHDIIVLEGGIAHVDLPCSGLKSLWTGTLFLLAVTWLERRSVGVRWLLVCAANLFLIVSANMVRVLFLVVIIHVWKQPQIANILHVPLGLLGFVFACALTWVMLQTVPKHSDLPSYPRSKKADPEQRERRELGEQREQGELGKLGEQGEQGELGKLGKKESKIRNSKLVLLLAIVIALVPIAQLRPPQEQPLAIASLNWPQQIASQSIPLTKAEKRVFDNSLTAPPQKRRFTFGNLSGSMLLVSSTSWRTHHAPELCLIGNGLAVDRMEKKQLTPSVMARWMSLQDGKMSATYWLQSSKQTTDDLLSRIWSDITRRQKSWVLVSVLFDSSQSPENPDIRAFATTVHDVIDRRLNELKTQNSKL